MEASSRCIPFGLLELDTSDVIVFYDPARECAVRGNIVGRNLFTDILGYPEAHDLQQLVATFRQSGAQFKSLRHRFSCETRVRVVTILLARKADRATGNQITLLQFIEAPGG
jgi:hypothetical protein